MLKYFFSITILKYPEHEHLMNYTNEIFLLSLGGFLYKYSSSDFSNLIYFIRRRMSPLFATRIESASFPMSQVSLLLYYSFLIG